MPTLFGCIEAGGTKFICGTGSGPGDLDTISIPTTTPGDTLGQVIEYFRSQGGEDLAAIGIGSFGPVDLNRSSRTWGHITATPKLAWQNCNLAGIIGNALQVPVGFDTDVNAAALGERRWGAAQGLSDFLYLTVGTGIGGGAMANGQLLHGLVHPEMGHIRIPRGAEQHVFGGICPFHGDCLEGIASGPAMKARWGADPHTLPVDHPAWQLEARYLALALATWVCTLSPQRVILGGGVMQQEHIFPLIRRELSDLLGGYIRADAILQGIDSYVVPPSLGTRSGALGALVLAEMALARP